jgi:hypothetical protein
MPSFLSRTLCCLAVLAFIGTAYYWSRRAASTTPPTISGIVRDEHGAPLAEVYVRFKGSNDFVVTDADGRFTLSHESPLATTTVTAWHEGYLIGSARFGRAPLEIALVPLPKDDSEAYRWVDPAPDPAGTHNCANCHAEMYREWSGSAHARSATGRHFRNLYDGTDVRGRENIGWGLLTQYPQGSGVCNSCHAPTVPPGDPAAFDLREVSGVAARGVHCDYCHKVVDAPVELSERAGSVSDRRTPVANAPGSARSPHKPRGKIGTTHGRDALTLLRPAEGQLFFGPLDDVDRGEDSFVPLYRQSRYCASCHEGVVFGVHVYSTYSEWLDSPARRDGKECQSCHMQPTGTMTNFAPGKGGIERDPKTLASHHMPGGTPEMLKRALKLSVALTPQTDSFRAEVEVLADQVGHRVPTGFIDRNLVLVVEPLDAEGKRLDAKAGPRLPPVAGRSVVGQPGRLFAKLLLEEDGRHAAPFWKRTTEPVDTRLVPGKPEHSEFLLPKETRRLRIRLLYRRFWPEVAESKGWNDTDVVVVDQILDCGERAIHWANR